MTAPTPISPQPSPSDLKPVQWSPHHQSRPGKSKGPSRNAILSIQLATATAKAFDAHFRLRNVEREMSIPLFHGTEVVLQSAEPSQMHGYYSEYDLQGVSLAIDSGQFGPGMTQADETRRRYGDRILLSHQHYSAKYLQKGIADTDHGPSAACEMILETKILMNLAPHPNILQIYGVNRQGIDSFLENGRKSFFLITDRLSETLVERLDSWREDRSYSGERLDDLAVDQSHLMERLEVANDICSALVFLHDRQLVMNIRPDKVGFDAKCGRVKLRNFGQARQDGMAAENAPGMISRSDDVANTLAYTAPEVLCQAPATVSTDVYGFGIMLWEIMSLQRPFAGYNRAQHYERVVQNNQRPPITTENQKHWPKEVCKLLETCWDPHYRPTIKTVGETLETALLFHEPESSADQLLTSSTAATCNSKERVEKCQAPKESPNPNARRRRSSVRRSRSDPNELVRTNGPTARRRHRSSSRHRRKSPGRGGGNSGREASARFGKTVSTETNGVATTEEEASMRSARQFSMEMVPPASPQRKRGVGRSKSLNVPVSSNTNPAVLREALTKLAASPDGEKEGGVEGPLDCDIDDKSADTPPTVGSNDSGSEPVIGTPTRRSTSMPAKVTRASLVSPRSHSTSTASTSNTTISSSSPGTPPNRQLTRRRSQSVRNIGLSPATPCSDSPSSPRRPHAQADSWATNCPVTSTPGSSRKSKSSSSSKPSPPSRGRMQRRMSDLGPNAAVLLSPDGGFCLDNVMAIPIKRASSVAPKDGPLFRGQPQAPIDSPTSVMSNSPKKGRKGVRRAISARDINGMRHDQHHQHQQHEDRRSMRADRTTVVPHGVVAKLKAAEDKLKAAEVLHGNGCAPTSSSNPNRVIRVKVKNRGASTTNATN